DFRLELEGVLKSWSIPKGPSVDPDIERLAMQTEDHPLEYANFEGIIPKEQYGGGTVLLWDRGTWEPIGNPHRDYRAGVLRFALHGEKLSGLWSLSKKDRQKRDSRAWVLKKEDDDAAQPGTNITEERPKSVTTGRDLDEIASAADRVWHSNRHGG